MIGWLLDGESAVSSESPASGDALSKSDAASLVQEVIDANAANASRHDAVLADIAARLASIDDELVQTHDEVKAIGADDGAKTSAVVLLDEHQWSDLQRCWGWAKGGVQVGLFLVLVLACFVGALLGSRLWGAFSKGWRR